jgi:hypothetical protein
VTAAGTPAGLGPVLKALGLSGMLDTLDARLAEARTGTLGHAGFLQVLCEDELARRDAAKITRRISAARFPAPDATLETFDFGYNPTLPAAQIRDLARLEFIAAGEGILAYGPVGVREEPPGRRAGPPGVPPRPRRHLHHLLQAAGPPGRRARRPQLRRPPPQARQGHVADLR